MPDQQEMTRYSPAEFTNAQPSVAAARGAYLAEELLAASGAGRHRELFRLVNDAGTQEVRCAAEYLALALFRMMTALTDGDEERARASILDVLSGVERPVAPSAVRPTVRSQLGRLDTRL